MQKGNSDRKVRRSALAAWLTVLTPVAIVALLSLVLGDAPESDSDTSAGVALLQTLLGIFLVWSLCWCFFYFGFRTTSLGKAKAEVLAAEAGLAILFAIVCIAFALGIFVEIRTMTMLTMIGVLISIVGHLLVFAGIFALMAIALNGFVYRRFHEDISIDKPKDRHWFRNQVAKWYAVHRLLNRWRLVPIDEVLDRICPEDLQASPDAAKPTSFQLAGPGNQFQLAAVFALGIAGAVAGCFIPGDEASVVGVFVVIGGFLGAIAGLVLGRFVLMMAPEKPAAKTPSDYQKQCVHVKRQITRTFTVFGLLLLALPLILLSVNRSESDLARRIFIVWIFAIFGVGCNIKLLATRLRKLAWKSRSPQSETLLPPSESAPP